jgi:formyltetrahydrofolate deformylase
MPHHTHVLSLSCDDRPGIVAAVTTELAGIGANIAESGQFWDRQSNRFFMRLEFMLPDDVPAGKVQEVLKSPVERFGMKTAVTDGSRIPKIIIMVSKFDHALLHLIYQIRVGWLKAEIVGIVSNHEDSRRTADVEGIPYYYWPVTKENKSEQEEKLVDLARETKAELIVLARYMQVISDKLSNQFFGKIINIHHSFLPSFKGARPYHQAFDRGVKLIGATAHYVTADLDEGPIIEQETERVSHSMSAEHFVAAGRDIESRVLARAVKSHLESRVVINGKKTIVF